MRMRGTHPFLARGVEVVMFLPLHPTYPSENRDFRYDRFRKVSEGKRDRLVGYQFTDVEDLVCFGTVE